MTTYRETKRLRSESALHCKYWLLTTIVTEPYGIEYCTLAIPRSYPKKAQDAYVTKVLKQLNSKVIKYVNTQKPT